MQQSEGDGGEQGRGVARKDDSGEEGHGAGGDGVEGQGKLLKASDREALQAALRNCVMQQVRREHGREKKKKKKKKKKKERRWVGSGFGTQRRKVASRICVCACTNVRTVNYEL